MSQLQFSPEFFKKEERCGFMVGEPMKRNWAAQIQVLEDVRELCEKHDIRWFAYAGTALGAVRHKGFIPWDDDVDIAMVGEDYIKFMHYFKDELGDRYTLLNPYVASHWEMDSFSRITTGSTMDFTPEYLDTYHNCPFLIGTDIFPFYYVPRNKEHKEYVLDLLHRTVALRDLNFYNISLQKVGRLEESREINDVIAEGLVNIQRDTGFEFTTDRILANQLAMLFDQISRLTTEDEADEVARYNSFEKHGTSWYSKKLFEDTTWVPFENVEVPLPSDTDTYLSRKFGKDYMVFKKTGALHEYPYIGKQFREYKNDIEKNDWKNRLLSEEEFENIKTPDKQSLSESQNKKCKVLYYTGVREMLIYSEYVIDKIKAVIEYFKANSDTTELYWMPGKFIELEEHGLPFSRVIPELKEDYQKVIDEFKASGIGTCDESADLNKAIDECDMFYGDSSFLSELFSKTGKPIYIQDYHITEIR